MSTRDIVNEAQANDVLSEVFLPKYVSSRALGQGSQTPPYRQKATIPVYNSARDGFGAGFKLPEEMNFDFLYDRKPWTGVGEDSHG